MYKEKDLKEYLKHFLPQDKNQTKCISPRFYEVKEHIYFGLLIHIIVAVSMVLVLH